MSACIRCVIPFHGYLNVAQAEHERAHCAVGGQGVGADEAESSSIIIIMMFSRRETFGGSLMPQKIAKPKCFQILPKQVLWRRIYCFHNRQCNSCSTKYLSICSLVSKGFETLSCMSIEAKEKDYDNSWGWTRSQDKCISCLIDAALVLTTTPRNSKPKVGGCGNVNSEWGTCGWILHFIWCLSGLKRNISFG